MNLIIIEPGEMGQAGAVSLSGARAAHLRTVLKVAPGHDVRVGLLDGPFGVGTVRSVTDETVELHCAFDATAPPRPPIDLLLAVPRPKVLRRLWAQLAALGVGHIILTNAERVERNYFDTHVLTPDCYRPLLIEGLQQARDTWLPQVSIHRQFKVLIEDKLDALFQGERLVAHPRGAGGLSRRSGGAAKADAGVQGYGGATGAGVREVRGAGVRGRRTLLAVGPEGGWNDFELKLLEAHGFQPIDMGTRTLRTDTACIALLALTHHLLSGQPA